MIVKHVRITNIQNVLVQIPAFIIAIWGCKKYSALEVSWDDSTEILSIRPLHKSKEVKKCKG